MLEMYKAEYKTEQRGEERGERGEGLETDDRLEREGGTDQEVETENTEVLTEVNVQPHISRFG